ncbi:hypothetical protein EV209_1650 [Cuneatibacter caecimuris]|uniref:Uncharacterized protein n=1 Tax=Cuneatibacter caecimuris TaxID=1796618 RepID=A0A4Q7PLJ3_9FIRM|nr:hypothetical protein EV209_1650 [Cuneatibacter caecimuris]
MKKAKLLFHKYADLKKKEVYAIYYKRSKTIYYNTCCNKGQLIYLK